MVKRLVVLAMAVVLGASVYIYVTYRPACVWVFHCTRGSSHKDIIGQECDGRIGLYSGPELFPYRFIKNYLLEHSFDQSKVDYVPGEQGVIRLTIRAKNKALARQRVYEVKSALETQVSNDFRVLQFRLLADMQEGIVNGRIPERDAESLLQNYLQHSQIMLETLKIE